MIRGPHPARAFKAAIRQGVKQCGAWLQLGCPWTAEIFAQAGFDFVIFDYEHGPGDTVSLGNQLRAFNGTATTLIVRTPGQDPDYIKQILDTGAHGVLVPQVNTAEQALAVAQACKYPPRGTRGAAKSPRGSGYGRKTTAQIAEANDETVVMVMLETATAVDNIDSIMTTPDLDALFLGPMDLATSIGHLDNLEHPEALALRERILQACLRTKMPLATISAGWPSAKNLFDKGFTMITLMADGVALSSMAHDQVQGFAATYR